MQSTTDNPNAAAYEAEEKRRAAHKAWLEQDVSKRRQATEHAVEAMSGTGESQPVMTQMENDLAMLAATNAPVQDPQAAPAPPATTRTGPPTARPTPPSAA